MPEHLDAKSQEQIDQFVAKHKAVIVDFTASWCGPCQMIAPKLPGLSQKHGVSYIKVDVDQLDVVAAKFGVRAMPTFIILTPGGKVDQLVGANEAKLDGLFQKAKTLAK